MRKKLHKKTYKGMLSLKQIFEKRINVVLGLKRDEIISLFYSIPLKKVIKLKDKTLNSKFSEIRTIKKYLLWKDNFPIIFKIMPRGTELYDENFGKRTLDKRTNIFFRCSDIGDAGKWRNDFDKIAKSFHKTGSKPSEILEEEEKNIPIIERIQGLLKNENTKI